MTADELKSRIAAYAYDNYAGSAADAGEAGVLSDAATGPSATNGLRLDTLYIALVPFTTAISSSPCNEVAGYHNSAETTMYDSVPFGVVLPCKYSGYTSSQVATAVMAHELVEAVTDPFPFLVPTFAYVDDAHIAWAYSGDTELADLCSEWFTTTIGGSPTVAETIWSNASAAKGHFPCVPAIPDAAAPVFQAIPQFTDTLNYSASHKTKGVYVGLNDMAFIDIRVTSLAPTGPLKLQVFDVAKFVYERPAELTLSLDQATAQNGDVVHVTIRRAKMPPAGVTVYGSVFGVAATDPATKRSYVTYGFVASKP